jgi:hypothetical protein
MALVQNFMHRGENWQRIDHEFREQWIKSIDLGCMSDPTAICVLHHTVTPIDGKLDEAWKVNKAARTTVQVETRFDVSILSACLWG